MPSPLLTIITPSYNLGRYLDRAIKSVLTQNYTNFEYWVIDGGSTDNSVDILKKYSRISKYKNKFHWISEKDAGQTNAINKGLSLAKGQWFAWLNADDYYEKGAFAHIASEVKLNPSPGLIYGNCLTHGPLTTRNIPPSTLTTVDFYRGNLIFGPSAFFNVRALSTVGYFDEDLDLWMDFDMFMRISKHFPMKYINKLLAHFVERAGQKSQRDEVKLINESKYVIGKNRYPILKYYYKWRYLL